MKRFYGLVLVCVVSAFAVGCDSTPDNEEAPGVEQAPEVQQQMKSYEESAKKNAPNHS